MFAGFFLSNSLLYTRYICNESYLNFGTMSHAKVKRTCTAGTATYSTTTTKVSILMSRKETFLWNKKNYIWAGNGPVGITEKKWGGRL
jgi:hypothetical protein